MDKIKELEELLKTDVLLEVAENISELEEQVKTVDKKEKKVMNEAIEYMKQVKLYFDEVILDIENGTLTQEQAADILEGLEDMRAENQEV